MEEEFSGPLGCDVEEVGNGSRTGKTRGQITEQLEQLRGKVITKAINEWPDRKARHVLSWSNRDKLSGSWLLCVPGRDTGLSNAEFQQAICTFLCLPSPACGPFVGNKINGNFFVDKWGDGLMCAPLQGDGWRVRHDNIKMLLLHLFQ